MKNMSTNYLFLLIIFTGFTIQSCLFEKKAGNNVDTIEWDEIKNCENKTCVDYQSYYQNEIHYVGEDGFYAVSRDSGETVEIRELTIPGDYNVLQFANDDSGYLLTDESLYRSIDGGKTWKVVEDYDLQNCVTCEIDQNSSDYYKVEIESVAQNISDFEILFTSYITENIGYIMGNQVSTTNTSGRGESINKWIYKTLDEGVNWDRLYESKGGYNKGFFMFGQNNGFFVEETSDPEDVNLIFTNNEWESSKLCINYDGYQELCTKRFSASTVMIILYNWYGDDEIALITTDNGCRWKSYTLANTINEDLSFFAEITENEKKLCSW